MARRRTVDVMRELDTPAPCRTCARNLGHYCMAFAEFDSPCWAHTESIEAVCADLDQMADYAVRRGGSPTEVRELKARVLRADRARRGTA